MVTHLLIATIPRRRINVEDLLGAIPNQTLLPDQIHLCLDGYGDLPSPKYLRNLAVTEYRTIELSGPGGRWRILPKIPKDATLIVLDDDQIIFGPDVLATLVKLVAPFVAVAFGGTNYQGFGGAFPEGMEMISMGAACMAMRAVDLEGLGDTYNEIREKCGFDPFGDGGDDEAVIAAHLFRKGVAMQATGPLDITTAGGTQEGSQFERRLAGKGSRSVFWQREEIARVTGWSWRSI
jgi:hypothetical protein